MKKIQIIAVSDNHCDYSFDVPEISDDVTSVLVHAGDATYTDKPTELQDFIYWMKGQTQFDYKLWIAGNHSLGIEDFPYNAEVIDNECDSMYIHDTVVEIEGLKFFGSNFTPEFNNWAFNLTERQSKIFWENAPEADVVVCHGPPYKVLDSVTPEYKHERPLGCIHFKNYLERVKPKVAMFGHIHGSGGMNETLKWNDDSETICYNVSVMNEKYQLTNPVTVIEL
jgi:Icc-related predicted phosphoesterase